MVATYSRDDLRAGRADWIAYAARLRSRLSSNVDMASLCQEAERIPLQLQMSLIPLPDGERDAACGCHP